MTETNYPRILTWSSSDSLQAEMLAVGVHRPGLKIMADKGSFILVKLRDVRTPAANILKQEMLAKGGEAAVGYAAIYGRQNKTDVILMGTKRQYKGLLAKLKLQPFGLKEIGRQLAEALINYSARRTVWEVGRKKIDLADRVLIMGILNVTPDSFYDGGRFASIQAAVRHGQELIAAGCDILDIGGESTRPGSDPIPVKEELARVLPVIKKLAPLAKKKGVLISIDTRKPQVAAAAVRGGAAIINDISGGRFDKNILMVAAKTGAGLVLMHIQGRPKNMQAEPKYGDLMGEIIDQLGESLELAMAAGVKKEKIVIDPGIGISFGKTAEHNLTIIKRLAELRVLGRPILLGPSRKRFIGKILRDRGPEGRLAGTIASCALAVSNGARILRVHDPAEIKQAARVAAAITKERIR